MLQCWTFGIPRLEGPRIQRRVGGACFFDNFSSIKDQFGDEGKKSGEMDLKYPYSSTPHPGWEFIEVYFFSKILRDAEKKTISFIGLNLETGFEGPNQVSGGGILPREFHSILGGQL